IKTIAEYVQNDKINTRSARGDRNGAKSASGAKGKTKHKRRIKTEIIHMKRRIVMARTEKATFAGGCFWCMVEPFDERPGIIEVVTGYAGGHVENPTYEEVCSGTTGHVEAVQITYDPAIVSYQQLVELFWRQIDPTDPGGQFHDRGSSYKTAIFYHNEH